MLVLIVFLPQNIHPVLQDILNQNTFRPVGFNVVFVTKFVQQEMPLLFIIQDITSNNYLICN